MKSLLIALTALLLIAGCSDVGQQLLAERQTFNLSLQGVHGAHVAGALPATQEAKLVPYIKVVQAALDAGDAAYFGGDLKSASVYVKAAAAGLTKFASYAPATSQSATTRPSPAASAVSSH